jgi:hypothetical protein
VQGESQAQKGGEKMIIRKFYEVPDGVYCNGCNFLEDRDDSTHRQGCMLFMERYNGMNGFNGNHHLSKVYNDSREKGPATLFHKCGPCITAEKE